MEENKKGLPKIITGYQKNVDSYLYFLNLMSMITLPYWIFKLDMEILLIIFLVFIFYYSDIPELKKYKIVGISLILFDILTFLVTGNDINCNLIYFIIIGIFELESFEFTFAKNYFRYYHIGIKIFIFFAKFVCFSHQDTLSQNFDKFLYKSVFFTMTVQLILKLIKNHKTDQKIVLNHSNEMSKFKTLCENYPEGIFICKVRKDSKRGKSNISEIIYLSAITEEILKIYSTSSEKEYIIQLANFEMINEVKANKNTVNFLEFILNSRANANSNPHDTQYGLIKCSITSKQSVVKINDYDLNKHCEENGSNFSYSYKIIAIEKLSDEKLQMRNIIYNNLKSKFLLTISHELNNPLNGLIYYCEKIITEDNIFKRSNIVQNIKKLKFAIKFFIKNLNLNSKIILREKIKIDLSMVNFSVILNKVLNKFIPFLDNKKIKCTTNLKNFTNIVIQTDYNYFKFFMKNVFMYLCHKIEAKKTLKMETQIFIEKKRVKLNFLKQNTKSIYQYTSNASETPFDNIIKIADSVQTEGMLREILFSLAENLNIKLYLNENLSEYILSFEIELSYLENLNEPDDIYELSPEAVNQKEDNMRIFLKRLTVAGNSAILESDGCLKPKQFSQDSQNFVHHIDLTNVSHNLINLDNNLDEKGLLKIERFKHEVDSNNAMHVSHNEESNKNLRNLWKINLDEEKSVLENNKTYTKNDLSDHMQTKNKSSKLLGTSNENIDHIPQKIADNLINFSKNKPKSALQGCLRPSLIDNKYINNIYLSNESRLISVNTSITGNEIKKVCCRDILVVDDEIFNISSIKYMLKNFKLVPDTCENGLLAVQKVTECFSKKCCNSVYKLILMDVMMPMMDGFEASRKIQAIYEENQQPDLTIIIISAHDSQIVKDKIKETTFIKEFVEKPVKKSKIEDLLKKFYL